MYTLENKVKFCVMPDQMVTLDRLDANMGAMRQLRRQGGGVMGGLVFCPGAALWGASGTSENALGEMPVGACPAHLGGDR